MQSVDEPRRRGGRSRRVERMVRRDGPLFVLCAALVLLGLWLRVTDLGFPQGLSWDEHHFVLNARNYLHRVHDWNDHPPFGKLLLDLGMLALGDASVGWRIVPMVFGIGNVFLAGSLARALFRDRRAGWLAAAFVAGDGFLIAYSRTALLDGMLTGFILLTARLVVTARSPWRFLAAAAAIGCAASIKMSGFALALPVVAFCLCQRRWFASLAALLLAPLLYTALFSIGLAIAREPHGARDAWRTSLQLLAGHAAAHEFKHPLTSHWYTWFLPKRPITLRYDPVGPGRVRIMTTLGNLCLWWSATIGFVATACWSARNVGRALRARFSGRRSWREHIDGPTVLFGFALTMLLPWIIGSQDSYIYHYLPSYSVLLVCLGGIVSRVYRRRRVLALTYVATVVVISAFYAPVWGQLEISNRAYEARVFLGMWR